jgi:hypothetical protein
MRFITLRSKLILQFLTTTLFCIHSGWSYAQTAGQIQNNLQNRANHVMMIMGYSLTPDVTTGSLSITDKSTQDPALRMLSLGGGDRISADFPLYIEGTLAINRYNPTFQTISDQGNPLTIPVNWNSISGTGGIGWDFPITKDLRIRPLANLTIGHVESDLSVAARVIENQTGVDLEFLKKGRLNAYGVGGSLMLDYENYKPERDLDLEVRYTNIPLHSFDSSRAVKGHSSSQSLSIWARSRIPTGTSFFEMPIRHVIELAHTEFLGDMRGAIGFNYLSSIGTGIEFDRKDNGIFFSRVRMLVRYQFGANVQGWSVGMAASF